MTKSRNNNPLVGVCTVAVIFRIRQTPRDVACQYVPGCAVKRSFLHNEDS